MFGNNLIQLRKLHQMTQEELAERIGVTRQAIGKWESGETTPDLKLACRLAEIFEVSLDELANHSPEESFGLGVPPKGKHLFGIVTIGEKGQVIIPIKARRLFDLNAGDQMVVLGDETQGLALLPLRGFMEIVDQTRNIGEK